MSNFTKVIKAKLSRFSKYVLTLFRCGQGKGDVFVSEWNVAVNLNDLCNILARQPLLLLLRKFVKEKINQEK